MKNRILNPQIVIWLKKIDWKLLVFLLLFLNFKLIIKMAAIIILYALRPVFAFGFSVQKSRLPLFYLLLPVVAIINWLMSGMATGVDYLLVLMTAVLFWALCILAIHQVKLAVEKNDPVIIHQTILIFFVTNALISLLVYAGIVWETGTINPYRYQGDFQKYFIGTGDYIKGLTFDTSTTNAVISALGVIYFLQRKKNGLTLLCMLVLLLTGSNFTNILLCGTLLYLFLFKSGKAQKSMIIVCLLMLVTFLVKVSPQNNQYIATAYQNFFNIKKPVKKNELPGISITEKPDSILTAAEIKQKFAQLYLDSINISLLNKKEKKPLIAVLKLADEMARPVIPGDSIHTAKFQHRNDTNKTEQKLIQFIKLNTNDLHISSGVATHSKLPGKLLGLQQTYNYFKEHPLKLFTGTGAGNFSSKLAFRATAMNLTGSYPARFAYINDDFKSNHLDLYLFYFTDKDDYHSVMNSPNNTYDQLLSEYGFAGLISFAFFYIGFFIRQIKRAATAVPLILFMLGAFFIEYWFEQLSVVVFFELLVLLNIKETAVTDNAIA